SRIRGIGFKELVEDVQWRLAAVEKMNVLGRNRDYHAFNAKVRMALRKAAQTDSDAARPTEDEAGGESAYAHKLTENLAAKGELSKDYLDFSHLVNHRVPTVLRDLFLLRRGQAVPLTDVHAALDIVQKHFLGAAMSHGALTRDSHSTIAAAFNDLDGLSNSGEGGEARDRNDAP